MHTPIDTGNNSWMKFQIIILNNLGKCRIKVN